MNVCDNLGDHLLGNVYVKFRYEEDAEKSCQDLNNRWYQGQPIYAELSPVTDFREACCRQYEMGECTRGGFCNFMHLKPISRALRRELYGRNRGRKRRLTSSKKEPAVTGRGRISDSPPYKRSSRSRSRSPPRRSPPRRDRERRGRYWTWARHYSFQAVRIFHCFYKCRNCRISSLIFPALTCVFNNYPNKTLWTCWPGKASRKDKVGPADCHVCISLDELCTLACLEGVSVRSGLRVAPFWPSGTACHVGNAYSSAQRSSLSWWITFVYIQ